jgi:hypothetical protein
MMNRNELRELMKRLEALEALAKLFNNLWFERIREDVKDTKVQAYLTVFDDAFPHMNHVIEFVRRSAELLSVGDAGQEQWARLHSEFDYLHRLLNQPEEMLASFAPPAPPADDKASELSFEEREALETVDQSDIDSFFVDTDAEPDVEDPSDDIDALFDTSDDVEEEMDEQAMDALFAEESAEDSITGEMITDDEVDAIAQAEALEAAEDDDEDEEAAPEAQAILEDAGNGEADATASTQELEESLEGVDEEDVAEEDVQRSDLLDGEVESDDDGIAEILDEAPTPEPAPEDKESADLDEGLFVDEDDNAADDDAEDDDLGELFEGEDEAEEEEDEEIDLGDTLEEEDEEVGEANGPGISADEMNVLLEEGDESSDGEEEEEEDEESSISEDEIDALFG